MTASHDPSEFIRGIQQLLVSDKKKIGFLFGAGTSTQTRKKDISVPAVMRMTNEIVSELCGKGKSTREKECANLFNALENELTKEKFNVETVLSSLEQKVAVIGDGTLNGLQKKSLSEIIIEIKNKIREKVSIHNRIAAQDLIHLDFAEWIAKANRKFPIEIFTTNYDFLFELAFEHIGHPYYTGFTGAFNPFFTPDSVSDLAFLPSQSKLWKIHGSLGWKYAVETGKVTQTPSDDKDILIYPSTLKYNNSQKQPYTSLMDRLNAFLKQDDVILFTCGYSFNDEHINERIISALKSGNAAHVIALMFDKGKCMITSDSHLSRLAKANSKISAYGIRNAIIGCKTGKWKLRKEPSPEDTPRLNYYFDEDAPKTISIGGKEMPHWNGEGDFTIPSFEKFIQFLNQMVIRNAVSTLGDG